MKPLIHFLHGKESGPWGSKITYLAEIAREMGYDVASLDYSGTFDPAKRVQMLAESHATRPATYLVGSSMGGWVALAASSVIPVHGLFLLAPAVYVEGYPDVRAGCPGNTIEIVHGWRDSLIPYQNVVRFSQEHLCTLHLVDDEHRLQNRLDQIGEYLRSFLGRMEKAT
jgi:pimeloyl-ACP methyl ester carboxylesterase